MNRSELARRAAFHATVLTALSAAACAGNSGTDPSAPVRSVPCPSAPEPSATAPASSAPKLSPLPPVTGGMWLLNDFPSERLEREHGFKPTKEWLDHVRLGSVRLARGCSGSFVSPSGLVLTNHHCAHSCIEQVSTAKKDYDKDGYLAVAEKDELKCPNTEINQLVAITDVTQRVNAATKGLADKDYNTALKGEMSKIEKECATGDEVRCDVVSLYHGGQYHLYKYRRYQDVRLVFAPEFAIAFFGGGRYLSACSSLEWLKRCRETALPVSPWMREASRAE
ncbi:MAG TPA: S46 family peptidase [Polyangiaceae bacterium]|nr:S46 family peptidase [Polyangiaceae bacterium]